jgi:DNA-directed RNA polymerase III subunit RPC11
MVLQISKKTPLKHKEVDDVLGGDDAWKNVAKTDGALLLTLAS